MIPDNERHGLHLAGSMGHSSGEKSPEAISLPGIIAKEPLLEQDTPS